jgi:hypothetical protein
VTEQRHSSRERPSLRQNLSEDLAVALLDAKSPPLIPMRRWIRQASIGMPASPSARCHEKTWA